MSEAVDAAVFGAELLDAVVNVAAGGLRRGVSHDPLQARELGSRRGHVEPAECVAKSVRVRLRSLSSPVRRFVFEFSERRPASYRLAC